MADMLKFRKGTWAQIEAAPKAAGTIYIAKDEKAMYVDVDASTRIRIGDFIRVNTVEGITPPYSTSALYYVESDNALLKYDGSTWKQINGTDDLKDRIEDVEDRLDDAEGKITAAEGKITTLEGTVGDSTGGLVKAVADNAAAIEANADEIADLKTAIGGVGDESLASRLTAAEGEIDTLQETALAHGGRLDALETESAKHALKTDLETLEGEFDQYVSDHAGDYNNAAVDQAIADAVLVETNRAKAAEEANANAILGVKATAEAAVTTAAFNQFKTENTAAIATAKGEATADANTYTDGKITAEIDRANGAYAPKSLVETVQGHTNSLATLNGEASVPGSVAEAKKAGTDAAAAAAEADRKAVAANENAETRLLKSEFETFKGTNTTAIENAQNAANAAQGAADAAQGDATKALADAATAQAQADKGVADAAAAQKAIDDYSAAHADDYDNDAIDAKVKAVDDVVKGHTSILDVLNGEASVAGSVKEAKAAADKAQSDFDAYSTAHAGDYTNTQIDEAIKVAKDAADAAQGDADTNAGEILKLQGAINTLNGDAETAGSVAKAVADAKVELEDKIEEEINAANAMVYEDGVADQSALPTTAPKGLTFVATKQFDMVTSDGTKTVYPGDLLIATGSEVDGFIPTDGLTWTVVHTGYDASLEQSIVTADGKIKLTSVTGADNGTIEFKAAEGTAATVSVDNNVVTVGMMWEDFPA